jgi:hypothetical protein
MVFVISASGIGDRICACTCSLPSVCLAYTSADAVFIGRLIDIRDEPRLNRSAFVNKIARFSVERVFKGKVAGEEPITIVQDYCVDRPLRVGEKYFVYRERSSYIGPCNRTAVFDINSADFTYASRLSNKKPIFTIRGHVPGLDDAHRQSVRVLITNGNKRWLPTIDKDGGFEVTVRKPGSYKVELHLPFEAAIEVTSGQIGYNTDAVRSGGRTIVTYIVEFSPNSCDERTLKHLRAAIK